MMNRSSRLAFVCLIGCLMAATSFAATPITTDSRIKTLVYNPNEVFMVTTHYGYQSNIEFGLKETIETISVGDRIAWQVTPAGRRLFIRAQEENAHTNMTVVTNLRAYQFDLRSSSADAVFGSEGLTYVVRFFYPDEAMAALPSSPPPMQAVPPEPAPVPMAAPMPARMPENAAAPAPMMPEPASEPMQTGNVPPPAPAESLAPLPPSPFNYRYTYSGPTEIAPVKIFDDGKSTFFKFNGKVSPKIAILTTKDESLNVPIHRTSDGLISVNIVAPRLKITQGSKQVTVYNEAGGVQ